MRFVGCAFKVLPLQPSPCAHDCVFPRRQSTGCCSPAIHPAPRSSPSPPQMLGCQPPPTSLLPGSHSSLTLLVDVLISSDAILSLQFPPGPLPAHVLQVRMKCSLGSSLFVIAPNVLSWFGDICMKLVSPTMWRVPGGLIRCWGTSVYPRASWHGAGQVPGNTGRRRLNCLEMCFSRILRPLVRACHVQKKGQGEKRQTQSGQKKWRNTSRLFHLGQTWGRLVMPTSVQVSCRLQVCSAVQVGAAFLEAQRCSP